jgi:Mrp family chromosome partitioning ATPase
VRAIAEIRPRDEDGAGIGVLRRSDLVAFAALRERLGGARAVLVTGTRGAAGPAAVGLATAAVAAGARAALLECDSPQPALARELGIAEVPGLREYVAGEAEASDILQPLVLAGPGSARAGEPLVCVVAGAAADDDAPLLASERFRQAVAGLREYYELLVVAGPPLERGFERLREVAALVDASVACLAPSELRGSSYRKLRRRLRALPGAFSGFVAFG